MVKLPLSVLVNVNNGLFFSSTGRRLKGGRQQV